MTSFAEDDVNVMTSSAAVGAPTSFDQNATALVDGASRWRAGTLGLLAAATSVVTVGGNLIVILSFVLERTIRQPPNYFIASLAVSDLLIGQSRRRQHGFYLCLVLSPCWIHSGIIRFAFRYYFSRQFVFYRRLL